MILEKDLNFEEKMRFCLKNDMRNLVNVNPSSGNSENLHFHGSMGYYCRKYVMFEQKKKIQRNCVVKNDLYMVSKMASNLVNFQTST